MLGSRPIGGDRLGALGVGPDRSCGGRGNNVTQYGNPPARRRRATLSDVAAGAGLSITTVSRALAGYSDVAAATRSRVQVLADQMGYRPSSRARMLAMGRDASLRCAVLLLNLSTSGLAHSPYGPTMTGILAGTTAEGMDAKFAVVERKAEPSSALARFVAEDHADGILLLTYMPLHSSDIAPLEESGVPYVLVNQHMDHEQGSFQVNCVTADWLGGTRDAVRRLYRLGHRRVAAVFARETAPNATALDHVLGWREAVAECGLPAEDAPIVHATTALSSDVGHDIGRRLLTSGLPESGERPTAIVAYNDQVAHGVLRAAREMSVSVPEELSVIGFDNSVGRFLWPELCSYDPHLYATGEQAALLLADLLRNGADGVQPRRVTLPLDFICRNTCAPAP